MKKAAAGRPQVPRRRRANGKAQRGTATLLALPAFLLLYFAVDVFWHPPRIVALWYLAASTVTFFAYAFDKSAAQSGAWRTPEGNLHLLALAGGWPGALLAQQLLRHKSVKAGFRTVFRATVLINVTAFVALASPWGRPLVAGLRPGLCILASADARLRLHEDAPPPATHPALVTT